MLARSRDSAHPPVLAFRSVADAKQYPPEECDKAAAWELAASLATSPGP